MKKIFLLLLLTLSLACQHTAPENKNPAPTQIFKGQKEGEREGGRERYIEISHRTPGVDWQAIEAENHRRNLAFKNSLRNGVQSRESFVGGQVQATWHERGASNQAGSVIATDYDAASNQIYTIGAEGIIFRGNYDGTGWTSLNDEVLFYTRVLQVVVNGGGRRLVAAQGKYIKYSDDEGATWSAATGLSYYDSWGSPFELIELNNGDLYYLVQTWIETPWGSGYHLYRSTNKGAAWTLVQAFTERDSREVVLWKPHNTNDLYLVDHGDDIYTVSGSTLTLLHSMSGALSGQRMWFTGSRASGSTKMYLLFENTELYSSTDEGENWDFVQSLSPEAWSVGIKANPFVANTLYYGEVNMRKSDDGGETWEVQNEWWEYYDNINYLHADIMSINAFTTSGGTNFFLVANHGGMHRSTNNFGSITTNIGLSNLNVGQHYEHVTGFSGGQQYLFIGTQDQGMQRISNAAGTSLQNGTQIISGDYVEMSLSRSGQSLWQEYPYGWFMYYFNPYTATWTDSDYNDVEGDDGQNIQLWSVPMAPVGNASENAVLVGGGTTTGDDGSYLIKLTAETTPPYDITATQFDYNFRPQANNQDSYITAIAQSSLNTDRYFVSMADGTFFYSHDGATTWNKTASFNGPGNGFLYGTSIALSPTDANKIYLGGNGYGGNGVYRSTNGGVSFTALSTGLPNTFVNDLALNAAESLLFAATEAGPYVCLLSTGQWYSLIGVPTPLQPFQSVEYIPSTQTARFGTYGRGIWDLVITSQPLPVEWVRFDAAAQPDRTVALQWETGAEANQRFFDIQRSGDGISFQKIGQKPATGSGSPYTFTDLRPLAGTNYYRLQQMDFDGKSSFSKTVSAQVGGPTGLRVHPSVVASGGAFQVSADAPADLDFALYNASGRRVWQAPCSPDMTLPILPAGVYVYRAEDLAGRQTFTGKLVVRR